MRSSRPDECWQYPPIGDYASWMMTKWGEAEALAMGHHAHNAAVIAAAK